MAKPSSSFNALAPTLSGLRRLPDSLRSHNSLGALTGLIALVAVFAALSVPFRSFNNLMLISAMASIIGIAAVGQTFVLLTGGVDFSVSSVIAFTGMVTAALMKGWGVFPQTPPVMAIAAGLLVGTLIGAGQGWMIAKRQMPPFIFTLGVMVGLRGVTQAATNSAPINALPDDFKWISDGSLGGIPAPTLIMLSIYLVAWYTLRNTKFGRYCYAIGGNETAARLSGVPVERYKISVYALNGLLGAVTGLVLIARIDAAIYTNGEGYELTAIAAAIIGGTSLSGGAGGIWGTLIGALTLATINNGLTMSNLSSDWRNIVTGAIILLAIVIDVERRRARQTPARTMTIPPTGTGVYLHDVLARLARMIEERLSCPDCRIYLMDRETGDLVRQMFARSNESTDMIEGQALPGHESLVHETRASGAPVRVANVARAARHRVVPIRPTIQSALAVPLLVCDRVIGVIEVQSIVNDAFTADAASLLMQIGNQMAVVLEDAWLLESGWLVRQVRDALRHLWDDLHLGRSELALWALPRSGAGADRTPAAQGSALRDLLLDTIQSLRPQERRDTNRVHRGHRILQLTYIDGRGIEEITRDLHISRRQYFYDQKEALEMLVEVLVRTHEAAA